MTEEEERKRKAEYQHRWYLKNKSVILRSSADRRRRMRTWYNEQKARPCMDCGGVFPSYVMDFDHRASVEKTADISRLVNQLSWKRMREEIAKCDLVCSNCHRVRTHERRQHLPGEIIERQEKPPETQVLEIPRMGA